VVEEVWNMVVGLIVDIEWMGLVVVADMVVVEKENIVVDMVVENMMVDMVDMTVEDYREAGFHKWVLANPVDGVGFGPTEETMPTKA
jgi:hypothetical protein